MKIGDSILKNVLSSCWLQRVLSDIQHKVFCVFHQQQKQTAHEAATLPGKSPEEIQELLRIFRPPDWLTDVVPRKQPYFPQMGDEVMYFRQGHEFYVKEVVRRKVYHLDQNKNQAWHKYPSLRVCILNCSIAVCEISWLEITMDFIGWIFNLDSAGNHCIINICIL